MKIQTQLFVVALSGICASCGTVSNTDVNNSAVAVLRPDARAQAPSVTDTFVPVAGNSPNGNSSTASHAGSAASVAPAPSGEVALATPTGQSRFAHLETFDVSAVVVGGATTVAAGRFVGDLVLDQKRSKVTGAGPGLTIIDGDLIVGDQCSVVGMTVTGDVIFRGNNSRAFVGYLGQVLDYGMQNQH
ncbi:MAG: hypothetical protein ACI89X_004604 [Planctomycetota bacterium]|jgi:hypothetical protein